jgi:ankyrin repeat protein
MADPYAASAAPLPLPPRPSLDLLRKRARALLDGHAAGDAAAGERVRTHHPRFRRATSTQIARTPLTLRDAQLVVAREHGFDHWAALRMHVLSRLAAAAPESAVTALHEAARRGDLAEVRRLLDRDPETVDVRGGEGERTPLHRAAEGGHLAVVALLLDRGADPTIRDTGDNATALHVAAERGSLAIVRLLVERGADVDGFGDVHGWDVLGWATLHDDVHEEVARYLLAAGARHNIFTAVAMGDVAAIRSLAAVSRDVLDKPMAIWESRRTPLHLAVIRRQPRTIPVLLDLGSDIEARDIDDLTPLDVAALRGEHESARILLERGARVRLPAAFGLGRDDRLASLLARHPGCLGPGGQWEGLIAIAAHAAPAPVVERLIAAGASVHVRVDSKPFGTKGYTPLHEAAWGGNVDAIEALVRHGAALDARDSTYDSTPLGWAEYNRKPAAAEHLRALGAAESRLA